MAPDMLAEDHAFSCPTTHGNVPPGEKKSVSVFFHPETLDIRAIDYLSIVPSGCASQTLLKVVGFCRGTGSPRTLRCCCSGTGAIPRLGLGRALGLLRRAWGLLPFSLGVCCPLVGSAGNQIWALEGMFLPWPLGERGGGLRLLGLWAFPAQLSVSRKHHSPSGGRLLRHPPRG